MSSTVDNLKLNYNQTRESKIIFYDENQSNDESKKMDSDTHADSLYWKFVCFCQFYHCWPDKNIWNCKENFWYFFTPLIIPVYISKSFDPQLCIVCRNLQYWCKWQRTFKQITDMKTIIPYFDNFGKLQLMPMDLNNYRTTRWKTLV